MAAGCQAVGCHSSGLRSSDAADAVLDHKAALWCHAALTGGQQEQVGRGLAAPHAGCAKDPPFEQIPQLGFPEAELDALLVAG